MLRRTDLFLRGRGETKPLLKDAEARDYYEQHGWPKALPLAVNPPEHRRYRDIVDHFFSVAGAETRRDLITRTVNDLLDDFVDAGEVEYMEAFAIPLPVRVITTMMGFPLADIPKLKTWSEAWVAPFSGQLDTAQEREVARLSVEFQHYIYDQIAEKRARPTDDVMSYVANTAVQLPDETRSLTDGEIINIIDHLYIGGNETTTFALTSGMWLLVQNREMQQLLAHHRRGREPGSTRCCDSSHQRRGWIAMPLQIPRSVAWRSPGVPHPHPLRRRQPGRDPVRVSCRGRHQPRERP